MTRRWPAGSQDRVLIRASPARRPPGHRPGWSHLAAVTVDGDVRAGLLVRRETTTDHPVTAAGFNAWSETVTSLRQQLRPLGWEVDNEANQGLIVNPEIATSIAVVAAASVRASGPSGHEGDE